MYGPGSNASKTYLVRSTRMATSAKCVTVNTRAKASPEKNPRRRSRTDAARSVLACPGPAAWTKPSPTVNANNPQKPGADGSCTNLVTPFSTFRKKSAPYTEESRSETGAWNRAESATFDRVSAPLDETGFEAAPTFAPANQTGAHDPPGNTAATGSSRCFCPGDKALESGFHPHMTSSPSV